MKWDLVTQDRKMLAMRAATGMIGSLGRIPIVCWRIFVIDTLISQDVGVGRELPAPTNIRYQG